ncbi:hypothetical protein [Candidatus Spongiihabitans sp.]|uniref:hypothetical protein n=1 Tax=Candidatus Spongiihabitans sp. TaxID=3101308 RepID=UPI003C6EAE6D
MNTLDEIIHLAGAYGLVLRGGFCVNEDDNVPEIAEGVNASSLILFGNAGSSFWECFSGSREAADGQTDPLNRWSQRVGEIIASKLTGRALFPFGGPPYHPFINWAKKAESLQSSRIGMLIHPQYGLWHAYRFAIALPDSLADSLVVSAAITRVRQPQAIDHDICQRCIGQPCLSACPVGAFSDSGYAVEACYSFLKQNAESSCRTETCQARLSCPQGHAFHYQADHARFHMEAFFHSVANRLDK